MYTLLPPQGVSMDSSKQAQAPYILLLWTRVLPSSLGSQAGFRGGVGTSSPTYISAALNREPVEAGQQGGRDGRSFHSTQFCHHEWLLWNAAAAFPWSPPSSCIDHCCHNYHLVILKAVHTSLLGHWNCRWPSFPWQLGSPQDSGVVWWTRRDPKMGPLFKTACFPPTSAS